MTMMMRQDINSKYVNWLASLNLTPQPVSDVIHGRDIKSNSIVRSIDYGHPLIAFLFALLVDVSRTPRVFAHLLAGPGEAHYLN